jgi:hypothetical protein
MPSTATRLAISRWRPARASRGWRVARASVSTGSTRAGGDGSRGRAAADRGEVHPPATAPCVRRADVGAMGRGAPGGADDGVSATVCRPRATPRRPVEASRPWPGSARRRARPARDAESAQRGSPDRHGAKRPAGRPARVKTPAHWACQVSSFRIEERVNTKHCKGYGEFFSIRIYSKKQRSNCLDCQGLFYLCSDNFLLPGLPGCLVFHHRIENGQ